MVCRHLKLRRGRAIVPSQAESKILSNSSRGQVRVTGNFPLRLVRAASIATAFFRAEVEA